MISSSILTAVAVILAAALVAAAAAIVRTKRQRDGWARIVTRLWDED